MLSLSKRQNATKLKFAFEVWTSKIWSFEQNALFSHLSNVVVINYNEFLDTYKKLEPNFLGSLEHVFAKQCNGSEIVN
jgi:hypothetical protein